MYIIISPGNIILHSIHVLVHNYIAMPILKFIIRENRNIN
jgi:hypothetical protein